MEPYALDVPRRADPYPYYAQLRASDPAHYSSAEGIWVLTRYDDCIAVLSDSALWSSQRRGNLINDLPERIGRTLGTTDPPRHVMARRLVSKAFSPPTAAQLEPVIRATSTALHDRAAAAGSFEYVQAISSPLNARILGTMFGLPEPDFLDLRSLLDDFFLRDKADEHKPSRQDVAMRGLRDYVDGMVEARAVCHGDDLVSAMLASRDGAEALTHDQVAFTTMTFLTAGFESTNNLFTNMVGALALHPELLPRLRRDPAAPALFVEETMRWDAPAQGFVRSPIRDVALHGRVVPEDAQVVVHIGAANRDPAAFPDPDRFDLDRPLARHLGLGHGIHFCIGASLGRLMARVAIEDLVARAGTLSVDFDTAIRVATPNFRGFQRLDVTVA